MAYSKSSDVRTSPDRVLVPVTKTRKQYGNNLRMKTAQMIPNNSRSALR